MFPGLSFDCAQRILAYLDREGLNHVTATSKRCQNSVLRFRAKRFVAALVDDDSSDMQLPQFVEKLHTPREAWCREWRSGGDFHSAAAFVEDRDAPRPINENEDEEGWMCTRPLHDVEKTLISLISCRSNAISELHIVDKRPNWSFHDDLTLHPAVVDHLLLYCTQLETLTIDHFMLSGRFSFATAADAQDMFGNRCLLGLRTLRIVDTTLTGELLECITRFMPGLEILHVAGVSEEISKEDYVRCLQRLPKLQSITLGYTFCHGIRSLRRRCCQTCPGHDTEPTKKTTTPRPFSICSRDKMRDVCFHALVSACCQVFSLQSLHVGGLCTVAGAINDEEGREALIVDEAFDTLARDATDLRRLHLGPRLVLSSDNLHKLCNGCTSKYNSQSPERGQTDAHTSDIPSVAGWCIVDVEELTVKTTLLPADLQHICEHFPRLRSLRFYVNHTGSKNGVLCDESLASLQKLPALEHLDLLLRHEPLPLKWYKQALTPEGTEGDVQSVGLSDSAIAALAGCPRLKQLSFGGIAVEPSMAEEGRVVVDASSAVSCPRGQDFDDERGEQKRRLTLMEWITEFRSTGLQRLVRDLLDRGALRT